MNIIAAMQKIVAPLDRRIKLMVSKAIITIIDDAAKMQRAQVKLLDGEVSELERIQDYGITSRPPKGSEAVAVFVGGNRDHGVVLRVDNREYRLKLPKEGDVALYDMEGNKVVLSPSEKRIEISSTNEVVVKAKKAVVESDEIFLGEEVLSELGGGVLTKNCLNPVTGAPHPMVSSSVKAKL